MKEKLILLSDPSLNGTNFLSLTENQSLQVSQFVHMSEIQELRAILQESYYDIVLKCAVPRTSEDQTLALGAASYARSVIHLLDSRRA